MNFFSPNVTTFVLNQYYEHWLLSNALHITIYLGLEYLKEKNELLPCFESLMKDEYGLVDELVLLGSNIRKEVCGVLDSFLSFLHQYERKKAHNMVC